MKAVMVAYGGKDILTDDRNRFGINRSLLESWIKTAWIERSGTTLRSIMAAMETGPIVPGSSLVGRYFDNVTRTQALLGREFNITTEVTRVDNNQRVRATVDLTNIIVNLNTAFQLFESGPTFLDREEEDRL